MTHTQRLAAILTLVLASWTMAAEVKVWSGYPPVPKPVRGKTELGVYIFPGWYRDEGKGDYPYRTHDEDSEWRAVAKKAKPRPLLGFYDDSLPEVNDWHILWALEHGVTWFAFDWYWNAGEHRLMRTLEDGFLKARYSSMMKFCIHWCNHGLDWHSQVGNWLPVMGVKDTRVHDGILSADITSNDPAFTCTVDLEAGDYTHLAVRMKHSLGKTAQMFWTAGAPRPVEKDSVVFATKPDGEFHDYLVDLREAKTWQGRIRRFRFDPNAACPDSNVQVDYIRLLRGPKTREGELAWEFDTEGNREVRPGGLDFTPKALIEMTEYMAKNYFSLPNYLTVDGHPVLLIWDTKALIKANGGPEGFRQALDRMNATLKQRGMKSVYLVSMGRTREEVPAGFSAMTGYGYYGTNFDSPYEWRGGHSVPYTEVLKRYETMWTMFRKRSHLPYIPPIGSSWDSRPRHGKNAAVISDFTPANYRRMCEMSLKHIGEPKNLAIIEAWNEWGEGSFIEPDQQYRFGFLDAMREVFTDGPDNHVDHIPTPAKIASFNVLKPEELVEAKKNETMPYPDPPLLPRSVRWVTDQPLPAAPILKQWEFGGDTSEGWELHQLEDATVSKGILAATVAEEDPQLIIRELDVPISGLDCIALRLKVPEGTTRCQVFWATDQEPDMSARKAFVFAVQDDGKWHTYQVRKKVEGKWAGQLTLLRFDTGSAGDRIELDWVRLIAPPPVR
ncbi:MAG: hypothetical protein HN380_29215 [Victivallales bacterium]|nr:hypothetical protein [Victivallales bacterium]